MYEPSQRAGDTVHDIIQRYSAMVYRLAYARTGNRADAEDVYQEVFFKFFAKQPEIGSEAHLRAWLIRATIHCSINLVKSAWRRYFRPMPEGFDMPAPGAEQGGRLEGLREALKRLPERHRVAIYLHYYEGLSTGEIADILGEKGATIRSRLMRGREKLKSLLADAEEE